MCKKTAGRIPVNVLIVSLDSTEFENGSGVNECANTGNMSDVHCKFRRTSDVRRRHRWRPGMWPVSQRQRVAFCPCF